VWGGIFRGRPFSPFFIEGNLTAQMYKAMFREQIIPAIREIVDRNLDDIYFQQELLFITVLIYVNICLWIRSFLIGR